MYADANSPTFQKSAGDVGSATAGALALTSQQIYTQRGAGYLLYNDEPVAARAPLMRALANLTSGAPQFGHSKGVVGWSANGDGFWIVVRKR